MSQTNKKVETPSLLGASLGVSLARLADEALSNKDRILAESLIDQAYREFDKDSIILAHLADCQGLCAPRSKPISAPEMSHPVSSPEHQPKRPIQPGKSGRRARTVSTNL